jgi:hypothetical protein
MPALRLACTDAVPPPRVAASSSAALINDRINNKSQSHHTVHTCASSNSSSRASRVAKPDSNTRSSFAAHAITTHTHAHARARVQVCRHKRDTLTQQHGNASVLHCAHRRDCCQLYRRLHTLCDRSHAHNNTYTPSHAPVCFDQTTRSTAPACSGKRRPAWWLTSVFARRSSCRRDADVVCECAS